jgi:RimJ/RimL family protein N-acetyltransferase
LHNLVSKETSNKIVENIGSIDRNMRLNQEVCVVGERVLLVPYTEGHVLKYHEWMQDEAILAATASEPLSLEEEYAMQRSWAEDEDKITFIVLDNTSTITSSQQSNSRAVGDVNCFLNDMDGDKTIAEIEIMIAEPSAKRKGLATEALQVMIHYCREYLHIRRFYAKIGQENIASLRLFKERMGFQKCNYVQAFQEYELELHVSPFINIDEARCNLIPYVGEVKKIKKIKKAKEILVPDSERCTFIDNKKGQCRFAKQKSEFCGHHLADKRRGCTSSEVP